MNRSILLNPGPVTLSERVRGAMQQPDLCHREPEFAALQAEIRERLAAVYPHDDLSAVLLTGSGTCAVEAMLATLVPRDGLALVVANGVYGERMAAMLAVRGRPHELIAAGWAEPLPLEAVAQRLAAGPPVSHVVTVHHETTTGRLNDLPPLAAICRQYGVPLLLDAVSSFGAEALDLDGWGVEACAATANKCLQGVPGLSKSAARRRSRRRCMRPMRSAKRSTSTPMRAAGQPATGSTWNARRRCAPPWPISASGRLFRLTLVRPRSLPFRCRLGSAMRIFMRRSKRLGL
jgi:2-aminoethylphosphonate-pyruvate transaminase